MLPDGPIDADMALDLLSRVEAWYPAVGLILGRLEIDVLRAAHGRVGEQSIRDAIDDEIIERIHGTGAMVFGHCLRRLERGRSADRRGDAHVVEGCLARDREAILGAVPDAGERVLALARGERSATARACLASALGRLGYTPAVPYLVALLDDPHRRVRAHAAWALGALRAGEAASALRRMLATERGRPEPGHGRKGPIPTAEEAESEARAALLAVAEGRWDPTTPVVERYPWVPDDE